jgi:hypothetical protein
MGHPGFSLRPSRQFFATFAVKSFNGRVQKRNRKVREEVSQRMLRKANQSATPAQAGRRMTKRAFRYPDRAPEFVYSAKVKQAISAFLLPPSLF